MPVTTALMSKLGVPLPIIQAPMAGGGDTPDLVAAVSEAGGVGFIGGAYLTPDQIAEAGRTVRSRTGRPFGINLFAPMNDPAVPADFSAAMARVAPYYEELGLAAPEAPTLTPGSFDRQFAAALETGAALFSFTFGIPPLPVIDAIKQRGMLLLGTATTVREALALEAHGFDAVVAQGAEAGGHRGTFAVDFAAGLVGTVALVPQIADAVGIPVIASGGIMDGRGIAAALALGAEAVQMGTAFLVTEEAGVARVYKEAILKASESDTRLTHAFSGRPARGILNRFVEDFGSDGEEAAVLPFPLQNTLTRPLRAEAARQGRAEFLSLWAGQGTRMARSSTAAALMFDLSQELEAAIAAIARLR